MTSFYLARAYNTTVQYRCELCLQRAREKNTQEEEREQIKQTKDKVHRKHSQELVRFNLADLQRTLEHHSR